MKIDGIKGCVRKLSRRFGVKFQDGEVIEFFDILSLEDHQIAEINEIASAYTRHKLTNEERVGIDLSILTTAQKSRVLLSKNRIIFGRTADELYKQRKVVIAMHSQERMLERTGSNQLPKVIETIQWLADTDSVLKAQFKGYSSLSYSLTTRRKRMIVLPISFKFVRRRRHLLSVTLISKDAEPSKLTQSLSQDDDLTDRMAELRRKIVQQQHKK